MQKKLIALAVAGLVAAPAFAQSNVTIYGRVDYGFMSRSGTPDLIDDLGGEINGKNEFGSGVQAGSRIGFKGAEDLGNGLKAIFEIEYGNGIDQNTSSGAAGNTTWTNRHSYVGLTGGFGTVVGGRLDGVRYNVWGKYDPFANGTVGNMTQLTPQVDRADNAVAYISPNYSGLTVTLAYSTNILGSEGADSFPHGGNDGDNQLYTAMLSYDNGPLSLTADYEVIKTKGVEDNKLWVATFAGSYDFGMVKISALYDIVKTDEDNTVTFGHDQKTWMIAAKAPIGKSIDLRFAFADTEYDELNGMEVDDAGASKWGIGMDYKLSKRTNIYADYGYIDNDDNGETQLGFAGNHYGVQSSPAGNSTTYGTRGFDIGIAHKF